MRTRNSVLSALHLFKTLDARISVNEAIAFLYTAENEGLTVQDLACVSGLTQSTASRSLRALGPEDSNWSQPPALGLVEAYINPNDARSHTIQLSPKGREVRDRIDAMIRQGQTISTERVSPERISPERLSPDRTWRAA